MSEREVYMARVVSIGAQDFEALILKNNFYVDKTHFIKSGGKAMISLL